MKKRNGPPTELMMPLIEPSFSSATVVSTLGHNDVVTGALIEGKLKGPRKLFLNAYHPEIKVANAAVENKYKAPTIMVFLMAMLEKSVFVLLLISPKFIKIKYKNVIAKSYNTIWFPFGPLD